MPVFQLSDQLVFPDPHRAADEGLLAVGGDLSPQRLLLAYRLGIFPWFGKGEPLLWWSPDPRCVFFPQQVRVSRRLDRVLRQQRFKITVNSAFEQVISACAEVRTRKKEPTWLDESMQQAYRTLYEMGYAHSFEAWDGTELAGGLYGVGLGPFFFGESMFHYQPNASNVVLVTLLRYMHTNRFVLLDCQVSNPHLLRLGARLVPRSIFLEILAESGLGPRGRVDRVNFPPNLF